MKKWWLCLPLLVLLTACGGKKDFETMSDQYLMPSVTEPAQVSLQLPEEAVVMTMHSESDDTLYLCDGFTLTVQTLEGGDLDATLRSVTGYSREKLQIYELRKDGVTRYECVWVSAGEGGDQMGKAVILDDGSYHYAVAAIAPAEQAGTLAQTWQQILGSAQLEP